MNQVARARQPIVLAILDGWGLSPNWKGNAMTQAATPALDDLWRRYPHTVLYPHLPGKREELRPISSEISHAILGAGRSVRSDLEEISDAIQAGYFEKNPLLRDTFAFARDKQVAVHLIGLASDARIHSDLHHLEALLRLAGDFGQSQIYLHLIADGQDVPPRTVRSYLDQIEALCQKVGRGKLASLIGRAYAMDRDERWERTRLAMEVWTEGKGEIGGPARIQAAYDRGITDEYLPPIWFEPNSQPIQAGDVVIVWNTRADRLSQLVQAFTQPRSLETVWRRLPKQMKLGKFVSLISPYLLPEPTLDIAFPPASLPVTLPQIIAGRGLTQLRVAESEKAAAVTYFFNGGRLEPFPGEDRIIIPSPQTASFAQAPTTRTSEIAKTLMRLVPEKRYDLMVVNFASIDLVAHTRNLRATTQAIQAVDTALGELARIILSEQGTLLVTADHGNAEQLFSRSVDGRQPRSHTTNPVPFILVSQDYQRDLLKQAIVTPSTSVAEMLKSHWTLADVAPTILALLNIPIPVEMTGRSLLPITAP